MVKGELVEKMAVKTGLSKKDMEKSLVAFQDVVMEELQAGGKVQLVGFGTFEVVDRKERMGRNPKTNEEMPIPAKKAPKFKAGKRLKDIVKGE